MSPQPCTGVTEPMTELQFMQANRERGDDLESCAGPAVLLTFDPSQFNLLEQGFRSQVASALFRSGVVPFYVATVAVRLCASHWIDLACVASMRSRETGDLDLVYEAIDILRRTCDHAGWDLKEFANLLAWRYTPLTNE